MLILGRTILIAAVLCGSAQALMPLTGAPSKDAASLRMRPDDGVGTPYIFSRRDSICGKGGQNPASITKPATVDYEALLAATDEARKIKRDRIDPQSAEGLKLMTGAKLKVLKACEEVRAIHNHCGVWKKITRRDGRAVADITAKVKAEMGGK
ncbi:MAG TPA: hypothetical protein EYQ74_00640 [Planctomycetes bacterium]|nr:hypothetical protein [Planctomycetota bacterium]